MKKLLVYVKTFPWKRLVVACILSMFLGSILGLTIGIFVDNSGIEKLSEPGDRYGGPLKPLGIQGAGTWSYSCPAKVTTYTWRGFTKVNGQLWLLEITFNAESIKGRKSPDFKMFLPLLEDEAFTVKRGAFSMASSSILIKNYMGDEDVFTLAMLEKLPEMEKLYYELKYYYLEHRGPAKCQPTPSFKRIVT